MIEKNFKTESFNVQCDFCSHSEEFETDGDWHAMIDRAKDLGWRFFKDGSEWKSKCPDCMEQTKEELRNGTRTID